MNKNIILKYVGNFLAPLIITFAFYIQINGDNAPGGGFQAGAIMASAIIILDIIWGHEKTLDIFSLKLLKRLAALGIGLYMLPGIIAMFLEKNFLDYSALHILSSYSQLIGITMIEWAVGFTVFASLTLIYFKISTRGNKSYVE